MMDYVLYVVLLLLNTFAMLDIWLIMRLLFGCDMRTTPRNLAMAAGIFIAIDVVITYVFPEKGAITVAVVFAYNVLVTLMLTNSHRVKTLLLEIPALLVYVQFGMFLSLIERITGLERYYVMNQGVQKLTPFDFLSDVLLFVLLVLLGKTKVAKTKSIQLTVGEGVVLSVYCFFSPFIVGGLEWFENLANDHYYNLVWMLFIIVLNLAVIYAIAHRKKAAYYQRLSEDYKKEFEAEYSFFKDYREQQQDIVKFRHDWKNHMLLLQEMLERGEYEKAEGYFNDLTASTAKSVHKIATGNELVDMILSTKMNALEENEITLQCKGALSEFNFMKSVDSCILLSNLLDNAIEANKKVRGSHYISLTAKKTEQLFYLEIKNPMTGELKQENHRIITTKEERDNHGIGLQNVYDIIKKYKGKYHIATDNQEYTIQMIFSVK
ncbi:MAG: ATP-binding protein [Bacteroidales bacterium]|nr:ATP-binding protein [Clostridium sp.]MCM1204550.1 ATP-binding protein [Bacteroidales bacterium]